MTKKNVLCNLRDLNYNLAFTNSNEKVIPIRSFVDVDVIQFMKNVKIINCMKESTWMFPGGIALFGNNQHFLHKNQIKSVGSKMVEPLENNYTITCNYFPKREL